MRATIAAGAALFALGCATASAEPKTEPKTTPKTAPADYFANFAGSLTTVPAAATLTNRGVYYVPAYSSLRVAAGRTRVDFAVTLSMHNASETAVLVIDRVDYFDTSGALVQRYVTQPLALKPFGTVEVFIPAEDIRGGTGANFVVGWAAAGPIAKPVVETVMLGNIGTAGFTFASTGRAVRIVPDGK